MAADHTDWPTGRRLTEKAKRDALERLAYELNWKQEQLDPSSDGDWDDYSEADRNFFRECVEWLLSHRELVLAALGETSPTTIS